MPDREHILHRVRTALGRRGGDPPERPPAPRLTPPEMSREERLERFVRGFPARIARASSPQHACELVGQILAGRNAVALPNPLLDALGILAQPAVRSGFNAEADLRGACATAEVGISSPDYALVDPAALVVLSSGRDDRLVSLLPPVHIALVSADVILTGLDELFTLVPDPAALTSSMVLIGGPSRTADIEMTLVQGVHGPGELHVVIV